MMLILLILIIYIFRDSYSGKNINSKQNETPIEILKTRYAKGEITKEEYQEIKQNL